MVINFEKHRRSKSGSVDLLSGDISELFQPGMNSLVDFKVVDKQTTKAMEKPGKTEREITQGQSFENPEASNNKRPYKSPIKIVSNFYVKVKGSGEDKEEIPISNFIIKPKRIIQWMDGDDGPSLECNLEYDDGSLETKILTPSSFSNRRSFVETVDSFNDCYTGSDKDLHHIKVLAYRNSENLEHILGYQTGGMQKLESGWAYVTEEGTLLNDGSLDCGIIKKRGSSQKSDILSTPRLSKIELMGIGEIIFGFNTPTITFTLVSYMAATFLKERLYQQFGLKFPHLIIAGESGSGKSSTLEKIIMKIYSLKNGIINATGITRFAADMLSNGSNTTPLIIDEYKPHYMDKKKTDDISNIARSSYDRHTSTRGNKHMGLTELRFLSPLIILGEASMLDETAIAERSVSLTFSKKDSSQFRQGFKKLERSKNLCGFGRNLLESALSLTDRELEGVFDHYSEIIDDLDIEVDRLSDQILMLAIGMELMKMTFEKEGIDLGELTGNDMNYAIELFKENIVEENLHGGKNTKSEMAKTLELMDRAFEHLEGQDIKRTVHLEDPRMGILGINISTIHAETTKFIDKYSIQEDVLRNKDLIRQLKKSVIYRKYGDQPYKKANIQRQGKSDTSGNFYLIDLNAAEKEGIELINFRLWADAHKIKQ